MTQETPTKEQLSDPNYWKEHAPEGATHWVGPSVHPWEKHEAGRRFAFVWTGWKEHSFDSIGRHRLCVPRPTQPQWTGEGLPPVGMECEGLHAVEGADWFKCKVNAYSDDLGKVWLTEYCGNGFALERDFVLNVEDLSFRPLRTQAEIERDRLVSYLYFEVSGDVLEGSEMDDQDTLSMCEAVIDAGYRKPMSREDAFVAILNIVKISPNLIAGILDALGFKE